MKILGIDPGSGRMGWGVINVSANPPLCVLAAFGCIETPKESTVGNRLVMLQDELMQKVRLFKPQCMAVELLFFGANSKTAMQVGQARGVIILTAARLRIEVFEYQGLAVKRALTGDGRADKRAIQEKVKEMLSLEQIPRPDDAADALGMALFHGMKLGLIPAL